MELHKLGESMTRITEDVLKVCGGTSLGLVSFCICMGA